MSFFLIVPILLSINLNCREETVNISAPHIYLGELLEIASRQTGVLIEASDKDGAAGEELVAFIKNKPIDKLMKDLSSLLSLSDAQWQWVKIMRDGKEIFQIQRSVRAKNFGKFLQNKEDEEFLNGLETLCKELPSKAPHSPPSDGTDGISFNYIGLKLLQQISRSEWKACVAENKKIKISPEYISDKLNTELKETTKKNLTNVLLY
ncbi:hypothetical protein [Armatimonas sp.]|uniref:hypothetical protein n=1 Tax=Armatimonas sp. TaxID=1872638 RepID=UPI00286CD8B8|nr:hypothetical protein [Armatimonas sp.]